MKGPGCVKSVCRSGTFITEFKEGKVICDQLLESDSTVDRVVDALALLMKSFRFDGYLLNIENPIQVILDHRASTAERILRCSFPAGTYLASTSIRIESQSGLCQSRPEQCDPLV